MEKNSGHGEMPMPFLDDAGDVSATGSSRAMRGCFEAFAVALLAGVLLSFLSFLRWPPLPDFAGECAAVLLFSLAAAFVVPVLPKRFAVAPILLVLPAVLALLVGIQLALGRYGYLQYPLFWVGYLALAVLATMIGQGIRAAGLGADATRRLAWILLIAGLINAAIQVLQALRLERGFAPFLLMLAEGSCRPFGNVSQANQASTLAWLALASALYLNGVGRLRSAWAVPCVAAQLVGSALAASRMAWLFLGAAVALILFLPAWPARSPGVRRWLAALLIGGLAVANLGYGWAQAGIGTGCASALERLADRQDGGLSVRLGLWRQAVDVWWTSPWIGVGAFNFQPTVYAIESLDIHRPLDRYVHNTGLQILAEFGLAGAAALLTAVLFVLRGVARSWRELRAEDAVILVWLAVIGIHSLLEFPLWYTYFLIVFGLAAGLLVRPEWGRTPTPRPFRLPLLLLALAGLGVSVGLLRDYLRVDRLYLLEEQSNAFSGPRAPDLRPAIVAAAVAVRFFRVETDQVLGLIDPINTYDLQRKIAATDKLLAIRPDPVISLRRVALSILDGDPDTARAHLRRVFAFFPRDADENAAKLREFVRQRPEEFAALGPMIEQELARRPTPRWR